MLVTVFVIRAYVQMSFPRTRESRSKYHVPLSAERYSRERAHKMYFLCKANPISPCFGPKTAIPPKSKPNPNPIKPNFQPTRTRPATKNDRAHKMYFLCKTNPMSSHQKISLTDYITRSYVVFGHLVNGKNKPKQTQSWRGHPGRAVTGPWPVTTCGRPLAHPHLVVPSPPPAGAAISTLQVSDLARLLPLPHSKQPRAQNVLFMQNKPNSQNEK
jgi:hypothetical protein